MKIGLKILLFSIAVVFLASSVSLAKTKAKAKVEEAEQEEVLPPPEPQVRPVELQPRPLFDENYINDLLKKIRDEDPNEAQRLEKLRQEDPRLFHTEIRKAAWRYGLLKERFNRPMGPNMEMERGIVRERLQEVETEFISWLDKNYPDTAKELKALKEKDLPAYRRRLSVEMKKYRQIIDTERSNPALAELLKKDLTLKQKRNEILEKLKATTDEKQKEKLTAQLKEVISERFDVILQKKQLRYEELKKKLEELQQSVNKSQAELENFKNNKEELINKHLQDLINQTSQFDWD